MDADELFKIESTKRVKIVVNGVDYERLADVPEPFRSQIRRGMEEAATKGTRSWKLDVRVERGGPPLTVPPLSPVPPPSRFRIESDGATTFVSWSWRSWRAAASLLFIIPWNAIVLFVSRQALSARALPGAATAVLLLLAAAGASMLYAAAAYLINRTLVRIGGGRLAVEHGPLPWPGGKELPGAEIAGAACEGYDATEDTAFEPSVTFTVKIILKDGSKVRLVAGLHSPDEAMFLEQEVRKAFLGGPEA